MKPVKFNDVAIVGLARDEAPEILSSETVEDRLGPAYERLRLPRGLLASLTGILRRRLYPPDFKPSQAAVRAAEKLLAQTGFDRDRLDILYSTSVSRDHIEPSTASIVQNRLGLGGQVKSLDIGSACLGFIDGLELAALALERGLAGHALVVAGENSRPILEATLVRLREVADRAVFFRHFATLTLGSGGAAMILGRGRDYPEFPRLVGAVSRTDARANDLCRGDEAGMETDSPALLSAGVALAKATFDLGAADLGWTPGAASPASSATRSARPTPGNSARPSDWTKRPWSRLIRITAISGPWPSPSLWIWPGSGPLFRPEPAWP